MERPPDVFVHRSFHVHRSILPNGLKVLLVENPSIPTVSLNASVLAGARYDPEEKAGLAIMVSRSADSWMKAPRIEHRLRSLRLSNRSEGRLRVMVHLKESSFRPAF
jgi:hypothetical protein